MTPDRHEYSPKDALSLAAIRWLANTIENVATEIYASSRETFPETEKVLKACVNDLLLQRDKIRNDGLIHDCPAGWELCEGVCAPACFAAADAQRGGEQAKR
jgi:hypothetical protein